MNRVYLIVLLILGAGLAPLVQAQPQDVAFEQVRLPGGYVSNFVNETVQDQQGFSGWTRPAGSTILPLTRGA